MKNVYILFCLFGIANIAHGSQQQQLRQNVDKLQKVYSSWSKTISRFSYNDGNKPGDLCVDQCVICGMFSNKGSKNHICDVRRFAYTKNR